MIFPAFGHSMQVLPGFFKLNIIEYTTTYCSITITEQF